MRQKATEIEATQLEQVEGVSFTSVNHFISQCADVLALFLGTLVLHQA